MSPQSLPVYSGPAPGSPAVEGEHKVGWRKRQVGAKDGGIQMDHRRITRRLGEELSIISIVRL